MCVCINWMRYFSIISLFYSIDNFFQQKSHTILDYLLYWVILYMGVCLSYRFFFSGAIPSHGLPCVEVLNSFFFLLTYSLTVRLRCETMFRPKTTEDYYFHRCCMYQRRCLLNVIFLPLMVCHGLFHWWWFFPPELNSFSWNRRLDFLVKIVKMQNRMKKITDILTIMLHTPMKLYTYKSISSPIIARNREELITQHNMLLRQRDNRSIW